MPEQKQEGGRGGGREGKGIGSLISRSAKYLTNAVRSVAVHVSSGTAVRLS